MRKGVTALQNVYSIYVLTALGVTVYYNLLYGFPGDREVEYLTMVSKMRHMRHLTPPGSVTSVQVTRFSPLAVSPAEFSGRQQVLTHHPWYGLLFPAEYRNDVGLDLDLICYYYRNYLHEQFSPEFISLYLLVENAFHDWYSAFYLKTPLPKLYYQVGEGGICFVDERDPAHPKRHEFDSLTASVYPHLIRGPVALPKISALLPDYQADEISAKLDALEAAGLLLRDSDFYLGIAFQEQVYTGDTFSWHAELQKSLKTC